MCPSSHQTSPRNTRKDVSRRGAIRTLIGLTGVFYAVSSLPKSGDLNIKTASLPDLDLPPIKKEPVKPLSYVPDCCLSPDTPPAGRTIIKSGDNLKRICRRFYNSTDPELIEALAKYNGSSNPDLVLTGQELRLPRALTTTTEVYEIHANMLDKSKKGIQYEVQAGDSAWKLAKKLYRTASGESLKDPELLILSKELSEICQFTTGKTLSLPLEIGTYRAINLTDSTPPVMEVPKWQEQFEPEWQEYLSGISERVSAEILQSDSFAGLSVEDKKRLLSVAEQIDAEAQSSLKSLLDSADLTSVKDQGGSIRLIEALYDFSQNNFHPRFDFSKEDSRETIFSELVNILSDPAAFTQQGEKHGTCAPTSMLFQLAVHRPVEFVYLSGLTIGNHEGVTLDSGFEVKIESTARASADFSPSRGDLQRILQASMMESVLAQFGKEYKNYLDIAISEENPEESQRGLTLEQSQLLFKNLFEIDPELCRTNKAVADICRIRERIFRDEEGDPYQNRVARLIKNYQGVDLPIFFCIDTSYEGRDSSHLVTLTHLIKSPKTGQEYFVFYNTWGDGDFKDDAQAAERLGSTYLGDGFWRIPADSAKIFSFIRPEDSL